MGNIVIKEVKTKKDMKAFIKFADDLYKDNEYYVPQLHSDIRDTFDREKNGAYEYCDSLMIIAYKDDKIAGRLVGIINYKYNEKVGENHLRFTHFDVIDDFEVTKAMFDYIGNWGKEKGMTKYTGPLGFVDFDRHGLLIEGFDKLGLSFTSYNYPYYIDHIEKLGFEKDVDDVEYIVNIPEKVDPRIERVKDAELKKFGFTLKKFTKAKDILPYIYDAFEIYNNAFYALHGTVLLTDKQIDQFVKQYIPLVDLKYIPIIVDKDDKVVGFAVLVPSLSKASIKAKGKMFPFGWFHLLRALKKPEVLDMYLVAIKPELQGYGLNSILMYDVTKCAIEAGIKYAETGPELENNHKVRSQWENYDAELIRKRRCYVKEI